MPKQPYTRAQLEELIMAQLQQLDLQWKTITILKEQNKLLTEYNKSLEQLLAVLKK